MQEYPLSSKVNTSEEHHLTPTQESEPSFDEKQQLYWNGTLRNTHIRTANGFPTTTGKSVVIEEYHGNRDGKKLDGVNLVTEDSTLSLPYKAVLSKHFKCKPKAAGKQIAHAFYKNRIITLYKDNQQQYVLIETDEDDQLIKSIPLDCSSAMISSVYKLDDEPILFMNKKVRHSSTEYDNNVKVYNLFEYIDFDNSQPKYEYLLDETLHQQILTLEQELDDQRLLVEQALNKYNNALKIYTDTNDNEEDVNKYWSEYILEYNKLTSLEQTYLETLWKYDPREEVKWCEKQIESNKEVEEDFKSRLDLLNEENADIITNRETISNNITKLQEHLKNDEERLYNMKAPELSEEASNIKKQLDNKLLLVKRVYDKADSDYISEVNAYRNALDNYRETISWSWAISSTSSRSGSYVFNGHRANQLFPSNNYTFGAIVTIGEIINLNTTLCGTFSGYGTYGNPNIRFSLKPTKTNGIEWKNVSEKLYLDEVTISKVFYNCGFNYKIISNYSKVVSTYNEYIKQKNIYNEAQSEYNKQLQTNTELAAYLRFVNSYNQLQTHIDEERAQIEKLQDTLNKLDVQNVSYNEQKEYLEGSLNIIVNKLTELEQQLKRANIYVTEMDKTIVLDENGNTVYDTLNPIFTYETKDGIPLGDAHSGTIFQDSNETKHYVIGFDDDDKNRALTLHYYEGISAPLKYKWFGCVALDGTITGEPIPDPDVFTDWLRRSNGTYQINMKDVKGSYMKGTLICGYEWLSNSYKKIEIDNWAANESIRVNMSVNDTLNDDEKKDKQPDPKQYFVSNFTDSRGIYYDYGPGWVKCYVRKISLSSNVIKDCYIYTYGSINEGTLKWRKESIMAKGKTKEWPFEASKLNKRVYTVGGNNKAEDSLLSILPFSVSIIPDEYTEEGTLPGLRMQMFGLLPLSFSYRTSLVSNGEEHTDQFQVSVSEDGNTITLSTLSMVYEIKKTSNIKHFRIWKAADYYFQTNILDEHNVLVEDRLGNLSIQRGSIPYCEECILNIGDKNLTIPEAKELTTNNTWYWAAAYNPFFLNDNNSSYILPAISIPLFINSAQLEQFQTETLEQRGSVLKPMLRGLFNEYEGVDIFYTIATVTTTLYYKTTNIVKTSDINEDNYDIYGKETYNVDMAGTTYAVSSSTQYFPIAVGSVIEGINYITPTIELENEYAVRLYTSANKVYGGYQYAARIYNGMNIFTIYGRNYYHDGQAVYFVGTSEQYTSNQFVCYALGMKYLASSGAEAYFYSEYDKQLYIFTGSNTMQKMQYVSNLGSIIDSMFSSQEQVLYILFEDNKLVIFSEKDTALINLPEMKNPHLEGCTIGCAILDGLDKFVLLSPYKQLDSILPFKLRTGYVGSNNNLTKLSSVDVLLFKVSNDPINIKLTFDTINGIERNEEVYNTTITPNMWKGQSYRIRYSPSNNVGNSFQIGIESNDYMAVSYLGVEANTYGNGAATSIRSR